MNEIVYEDSAYRIVFPAKRLAALDDDQRIAA